MFYCPDCKAEFETPEDLTEMHNLQNPPFELIYVCPFCKSTDFYEKSVTHCRCCGVRLRENEIDYCSKECMIKGKKLWEKELKRRNELKNNPINEIIRELENFNKINGTDYSYGYYVALFKNNKKVKKCSKKRKNT